MRRRIALASVVILASILVPSFSAASGDGALEWRTDLAAAQVEASVAGLPMLVVFR